MKLKINSGLSLCVVVLIFIYVMPTSICLADGNGCYEDVISNVTEEGVLFTVSGNSFQFLGQDFINFNKWKHGEQISICSDKPNSSGYVNYKITDNVRKEILAAQKLKSK